MAQNTSIKSLRPLLGQTRAMSNLPDEKKKRLGSAKQYASNAARKDAKPPTSSGLLPDITTRKKSTPPMNVTQGIKHSASGLAQDQDELMSPLEPGMKLKHSKTPGRVNQTLTNSLSASRQRPPTLIKTKMRKSHNVLKLEEARQPSPVNPNHLQDQDGHAITVQEFLRDVEMLKAGKQPKNVRIGLKYTEFQKMEDADRKAEEEREKNGNFKSDIAMANRQMGDLKYQKKKAMQLYEQLEHDLTKFELEEEEEILKLMSQEDVSDDEDARRKTKGEIRISDQNMFENEGPQMASQEPEIDDNYDEKMKAI